MGPVGVAAAPPMAGRPALGALGWTFSLVRAMQTVALLGLIGLTANFVAGMVADNYAVPAALVGTLVVSCLAVVYAVISYILYWDAMLPLLVSAAADGLCLVAVIVVACVVGKPVSYLDCPALPAKGTTANFIQSLFRNLSRKNGFEWIDPDQRSCFQLKTIWGLSISLCLLFFLSLVSSAALWMRARRNLPLPKGDE